MTETEFKQLKYAIALKMEELRSLQNQHLAETGQEYLAIGHRTDTDVTDRVRGSSVADVDAIYLDKCVCGGDGRWIYDDEVWICPECGARLYFKQTVRVYEVRR